MDEGMDQSRKTLNVSDFSGVLHLIRLLDVVGGSGVPSWALEVAPGCFHMVHSVADFLSATALLGQ